jgi:hypothetical protein
MTTLCTSSAGLGEQLLNDHFGLFVLTFPEAMVPNLPLGMDEVERRWASVDHPEPLRLNCCVDTVPAAHQVSWAAGRVRICP